MLICRGFFRQESVSLAFLTILYQADETQGSYDAFSVEVLTFDDARLPGQVAEVTAFLDPSLVPFFGFPLPVSDRT